MTKQKKSFLGRIAGFQENEENEEKQIEIEDNSKETDDNENSVDNNKTDEGADIKDEQEKKDGEWFDSKENNKEEEGQLTVDVYQTKDLIIIKSIVGGVASEDLDISITSEMITIKGTRVNPDEVKTDDYYYQECFWGCFSRSIILPCDIKTEGVEATMKNGILTIKLPKIEKNSSMKIKVKSEE